MQTCLEQQSRRILPAKDLASVGKGGPPFCNLEAAEFAVRQLLVALGEQPDRDGLQDTPRRVAKAMAEMMAGRNEDPAVHLARTFE